MEENRRIIFANVCFVHLLGTIFSCGLIHIGFVVGLGDMGEINITITRIFKDLFSIMIYITISPHIQYAKSWVM